MMKFGGISLLLITLLASVSGCTSMSDALSGTKVDYRAASEKPQRNVLEVPPDLSNLPRDDRYAVPGANGTTTLSQYNQQRVAMAAGGAAAGPTATSVLPAVKDAHIERAGGQRWLVVNETPEQLFPILREFWQDNGFLIQIDSPQTGILETDWEENHAKLPLDFVRRQLGHFLDSIYDTGERDKFRTRLERRPDGGTEIYISHRGMVEVVTSQQNQTTVWTQRPSDPELEAEFLNRLLVRLGTDETKAKMLAVQATSPAAALQPAQPGVVLQPQNSRFVAGQGGAPSFVELTDPVDRSWRRVGLALDRVSFTVEDRDRNLGLYYVRYVDPEEDTKDDRGLLSRVFSSDDPKKEAAHYRIQVKAAPDGSTTRVTVLNKDGAPEMGDAGTRILTLLNDQLK
jgi:outer membrane protein assembly factor BamC